MLIQVNTSALKQTRWYELLARFCLGGLITAAAGIIAKKYGPGVGGLFLAFPAIFPAGATLIEKHERDRKREAGLDGKVRARRAASADAAGAAMGSIGLLLFALIVSRVVTEFTPWIVIAGATLSWMAASVSLWLLRKHDWKSSPVPHEGTASRRPPSC